MTTDTATVIRVSEFMFLSGVTIGLLGMLSTAFVRSVRYARRLYWFTWLVAGGLMALAASDRGAASVCLVGVAAGAFALTYAYLRTPYLKVGTRIFAYTIPDSRPDRSDDGCSPPPAPPPPPPDSYFGYLTAPKLWWTLAVITCALAYTSIELGFSGVSLALGAFSVGILAVTGHLDARGKFTVARRQLIQAGLILVASIPLFLAPPLAYVATFWAAGGSFKLTNTGDGGVR